MFAQLNHGRKIRLRQSLILLVLLMSMSVAAAYGQADWENKAPSTSPSVRRDFSMANGPDGRPIIYGGWDGGATNYFETWKWSGTDWTKITTASAPATTPTAHDYTAMALDTVDNRVILFGGSYYDGYSNQYINETWVFDGSTWTNVTPADPADSPSARRDFAIATGPNGRVFIYGGWNGGATDYFETWEWNGSKWNKIASASAPNTTPTANAKVKMARDSVNNNVILWGGYYYDGSNHYVEETWSYNGSTWQMIIDSFPSDRRDFAMATGPTGRPVIYGGWENNSTEYTQTYEWSGGGWSDITEATAPTARIKTAIVIDSVDFSLLLFGGAYYNGPSNVYVNETWAYELPKATININTGGVGSFQVTGTNGYNSGALSGDHSLSVSSGSSYTVSFSDTTGYRYSVGQPRNAIQHQRQLLLWHGQ